jgi:hypothetical protein
MNKETKITLGMGLVLFLFILMLTPVFTIWSLNLLFHTNIEVDIGSYLAVLWLTSIVAVTSNRK